MRGYQAVAKALAAQDVDVVFGLIGDANMHYVATFVESEKGRYIGAVTEAGALGMADGYARISGKVGVASVTHGPGATNTVTALIEAVRAQSAVVVITGDPVPKRGFAQRVDLAAIFGPTGAHYHRVLSSDHIVRDTTAALTLAVTTRSPVVLNIPFALMHDEVRSDQPTSPTSAAPAPHLDVDSLDEALGIIASARRPLILAGRGAVRAGAIPDLSRLAKQLGAPLATTASAKDAFVDHPHNLGIMGSVASARASSVMARADCILAFGASLSRYTTLDGDILAEKAVVLFVDRPTPFANADPTLTLLADAKSAAATISRELATADIQPTPFVASEIANGNLKTDPRSDFFDQDSESAVDPRAAMVELDSCLPPERVIVSDVGRFVTSPWRYLHVQDPRLFAQTGAFASIGLGIPAAIGAAVASPPGHLTLATVGDGAAMMSIVELSTAARHEIQLAVLVFNDGAYGAEYSKFEALGFAPQWSYNQWPDLSSLAQALGCQTVTVRNRSCLADACRIIADSTGPLLVDLVLDPTLNPAAE